MDIGTPPDFSFDSDETESDPDSGLRSVGREPIGPKEKQHSSVMAEEEKKKAVVEEVKAFNAECLALKKLETDISSVYATIFERHGALLDELNAQQWPHCPENTASQMRLPPFRSSLKNISASNTPDAKKEA